ncbi:MAG: methyltransferase domain-containing protein [Chloroflexi bacterium]|nr:methyltransferase domain-containing protein [Chloroflexota bacterium]
MNDPTPYPPEYFAREDDSDDRHFYRMSRKVVHIDQPAIDMLRERVFRPLLPEGGRILDLMSSWRSHLPPDVALGRVVGLGLNGEEMADNPQLDDYVEHDLNTTPDLPFADDAFDAALCTVSIQYLTRPVEVFSEVRRVLIPGAPFIVSFSNRCFPSKAVWVWLFTDDAKHQALVIDYLERAGFDGIHTADHAPRSGDPLYAVIGHAPKDVLRGK